MSQLKNIVLKLAYDGTDFFGWQKTDAGPSIEEELSKTLEQILQEPVSLQAASRTDRGVHANGQVVNFLTHLSPNLWKLKGSLNALLPPTIRVRCLHPLPPKFHPSLHAQQKEYHYQICTGPLQFPNHRLFSWHIKEMLDVEKMRQGAKHLIGIQDFTSFCTHHAQSNYTDTIRHICAIDIACLPQNRLTISVKGNHFLYKMVRTVVGTLVAIGKGKQDPDSLPLIISKQTRTLAGVTAPAHGLCLMQISYPQQYCSCV